MIVLTKLNGPSFALNPDGSIDQAKMRAVSPETDFSFDFQDLLLKPVSR